MKAGDVQRKGDFFFGSKSLAFHWIFAQYQISVGSTRWKSTKFVELVDKLIIWVELFFLQHFHLNCNQHTGNCWLIKICKISKDFHRLMVTGAWITTLVLASPQAIIFRCPWNQSNQFQFYAFVQKYLTCEKVSRCQIPETVYWKCFRVLKHPDRDFYQVRYHFENYPCI